MVKDNLPTSEIISESPLEIVWAKVHTKSKDDLIIGSFYCPPNSPPTVFDELVQNLDDIKERYPHSKIIIAGDFNCPGTDWEHGLLLTDMREAFISVTRLPTKPNCYFSNMRYEHSRSMFYISPKHYLKL